jgi:hypothetical protein
MAREQTLRPIASHVASRRGQDATKALRSGTWRRQTYRLPRDKARGARTPVGGNDQRPSLGLLVMALAVLRQPLTRDESVLVTVAFAAMLGSSAALSQAEAETEVAPSQPVETVPTAPPTPPRVVPDEPAASTPPVVAPNESVPSSSETAAPNSSETAPAPLPTGAPASDSIESPAQAPKVPQQRARPSDIPRRR